ncbi:MAG TPA: hypothetical protein VJ850_07035 [Candidatus Limnocylindrales bacterium]|nr:hypothetical protein [Candidatus Limnocylindrales bacterium]
MIARRLLVAVATLALLLMVTSAAFATTGSVTSKTIDTTTGECVNSGNPPTLGDGVTACGAAVYGADGFSGHISGTGTVPVTDYLCVHTPGDGAFVSYGGTYTLTLYGGGNALIGSETYTVTGGQECTDGLNASAGTGISVDFDANSGSVAYTLTVDGITSANAQTTFSGYNSILNRAKGIGDAQAQSPSVAPPGPPGEVPEAPFAALLVLSAGLLTVLFLMRRTSVAQPTAI